MGQTLYVMTYRRSTQCGGGAKSSIYNGSDAKKKIKMNIYMRYLITVKYMTNRLEFSSYEAHMCRGKT